MHSVALVIGLHFSLDVGRCSLVVGCIKIILKKSISFCKQFRIPAKFRYHG